MLRSYTRDPAWRLVRAATFLFHENSGWSDLWSRFGSALTEHRFELQSRQPSISETLPFTCESDSTAPEDGDLDGWERWLAPGAALTYHARGVGLRRVLRCATSRWEARDASGDAYRYAARSPETLRFGDPGCAWCFLRGVPAERFELDGGALMDEQDCEAMPGPQLGHYDLVALAENRGDCDDAIAISTHELFRQTPPLQTLVFEGAPRWTKATLDSDVLAEVRWGRHGLPTQARVSGCRATWHYEWDARGQVIVERRETAAGVSTWAIVWSATHPQVLSSMRYTGPAGAVATIEFDAQGNLIRAQLPETRDEGKFYSRAQSDGSILVDYPNESEEPFTTREGWIPLLFELAVDPLVPEHNLLFPVPQFAYALLESATPLVAAGVWGTGRGPTSDLDLAGRFGPHICR